jgi:hypothetical protein
MFEIMPVLHPDLIITQCPHVSNHYIAPPKYVQLLWPIENKMKLKKMHAGESQIHGVHKAFILASAIKKK